MAALPQILGILVLVLGIAGLAAGLLAGNAVADADSIIKQQTRPEFQEQAQLISTVLGFMGSAALILEVISAGNVLTGIALVAVGRQKAANQ